MKGLSWFNKIVFAINIVFAFLLLTACAVHYISSEKFSLLSFLSLTVPFLVGVNLSFFVYWVIRNKSQLWLSFFVLVFGYFVLGTFVRFNFSEEKVLEEDLSVMSYNVRGFNKFGGLDNPNVFEDVKSLIDKEDPDVICFQEAGYLRREEYTKYPYKFLKYINNPGKVLLGIFSKYPIVKSDLINFPRTSNNAAYADILYKKDTIRIYNLHLQSLKINPDPQVLQMEPSDKLFKRLTNSFKMQQEQAKIIKEHCDSTSYKILLCGDFNNTQYSSAYYTIKGDRQDTFVAKGSGFGKTYNFSGIPIRIDYILADEAFEVKSHKNYDEKLSDHYPVMATFSVKSE